MKYRLKNSRLKLYCRKADAVHPFIATGEYLHCEIDGQRMLAANVVAQYATDEDYVMMPDEPD